MKRRRHKGCKTCRCFAPKTARHVCSLCGTRKMEKFMERTGRRGAFGKDRWRCLKQPCEENANYGGARPGPNELARSRAGFGRPNAPMAHARTSA